MGTCSTVLYFLGWLFLGIISIILNVLNYDWSRSSLAQGIIMVMFLGVIQANVLELVVMAIAALFVKCCRPRDTATAPSDNLTVILNYNLLALSEEDVDETFDTMFRAYMSNLSPHVAAVLVSATREPRLKRYEMLVKENYRALVKEVLEQEGTRFALGKYDEVDQYRLDAVWRPYARMDSDSFLKHYLPDICRYFAREFMVVQRVSKVLKKCGQYQDLMLLSEGSNQAWSYTDRRYYGSMAREFGEPLFYPSEDVENIQGRRFNYTMVLDGDTKLMQGSCARLLSVAAAHPEKGILQPAIHVQVREKDSMFMHLEALRQTVHEPLTRTMAAVLGQCGYFGKALIKNEIYIREVLGTPERPLEKVPLDVLSHDTFEAAILKTAGKKEVTHDRQTFVAVSALTDKYHSLLFKKRQMPTLVDLHNRDKHCAKPKYVPDVYLVENPCFNYITWHIRESRWNRGEVLLAMYFWPWIGAIMRFLQRALQGDKANIPKLRTKTHIDFVTAYIAYNALRQMSMKPCLLAFILVHVNIHLYYYWIPFLVVMFLCIVFPKIAIITCSNWPAVILETFCSIVQFTPEAVIGTVRFFRAIEANICACCPGWTPQRVVEEEMRQCNPFRTAFKHLWAYVLTALVCMILVLPFLIHIFMFILFIGIFMLPFFCAITSYNSSMRSAASYDPERQKPVEIHDVSSAASLASTETTSTLSSEDSVLHRRDSRAGLVREQFKMGREKRRGSVQLTSLSPYELRENPQATIDREWTRVINDIV